MITTKPAKEGYGPIAAEGTLYRPVQMALNDHNNVVFYAIMVEGLVDFGDGVKVNVELPRFTWRADVEYWPLMLDNNDCAHYPRPWHAMLMCTAELLNAYHSKKDVLEGTLDKGVYVRQVLQSKAKLFDVDVHEMTKHFGNCRLWLGHNHLQHPATMDAIINNLRIGGQTRVH